MARRWPTFSTLVISLLAAMVAALSQAGAVGAAPLDGGGACAPYVAILTPGTWETNPSANPDVPVGMLAPVGKGLKSDYGSSIDVKFVPYSASAFDKGLTYAQSQQSGKNAVNRFLTQCAGSKFVLGGYSQGADVVGDVAADIGNGRGVVPASQVLGVGLLADPKQGTQGATTVGPKPVGTGISGTRPEGFGALSAVTKQICATGDLYCNVSQSQDGLLGSLGKLLGAPAGGTPSATAASAPEPQATTPNNAPGTAAATNASLSPDGSDLVSNFSSSDLAGAASTASMLTDQVNKLQGTPAPDNAAAAGQIAGVGALAQQLVSTFQPVQQTQQFVQSAPGVAKQLATAPAGTPAAQANSLLSTFDKMDIGGIVNNAASIASTLASAAGAGAGADSSVATAGTQTPSTTPGNNSILPSPGASTDLTSASSGSSSPSGAAPDFSALTGQASQLSKQVAPLSNTPADALATAGNILGTLKPSTVINQALNVVSAVVGTDYQGIINSLATLPQQVFRGDVRGAHSTARMLNKQFEPWVKMASQIDFNTAAQIVNFIPDPSGTTAIVSMVLGLLANVDIVRLARDVGQIQEVAWSVIETGNLLTLAQLVPIGLDLASVGLGVLSPGAKLSPAALDSVAVDPAQQQIATASAGKDLPGIASGLVGLAGSQGAEDLTKLVGQGLDAASFYASNVHSKYASMIVEGGKTAIQWLADFFRKQISG